MATSSVRVHVEVVASVFVPLGAMGARSHVVSAMPDGVLNVFAMGSPAEVSHGVVGADSVVVANLKARRGVAVESASDKGVDLVGALPAGEGESDGQVTFRVRGLLADALSHRESSAVAPDDHASEGADTPQV
jgi:hypothetical protein